MSWISATPAGSPWSLAVPELHHVPISIRRPIFCVIGELEHIISNFIDAGSGARPKPPPLTPILKFDDYLHIGVQFWRLSVYTCEFCIAGYATTGSACCEYLPRFGQVATPAAPTPAECGSAALPLPQTPLSLRNGDSGRRTFWSASARG